MNKIKNLPNCITALRIIGTLSLLFTEPFGKPFFIIYTLAGVTDVLDGAIARKTKCTSEFGAKLDSAADLLFYAVMILKIFTKLLEKVVRPIWVAVSIIVAMRLAAYITALVKYHCFASLHTYLNKLTGFSVFCTPYMYNTQYLNVFCVILCTIAFLSSAEELCVHFTRKNYRSNLKTIFEKE